MNGGPLPKECHGSNGLLVFLLNPKGKLLAVQGDWQRLVQEEGYTPWWPYPWEGVPPALEAEVEEPDPLKLLM